MPRTPRLLCALLLSVAACGGPTGPTAPSVPSGQLGGATPSGAPPTVRSAAPVASAPPKAPTIREDVVQSSLSQPWDVAFLPDGRMLVSERAGVLLVFENGDPGARRLGELPVPAIRAQGESGLMSIVVDPRFASNGFIYACASRTDEGQWLNQVLRLRLTGNTLSLDGLVIRQGMRAASIHDGCRLAFAPDGKLWVTMGDASERTLAQDVRSLNGKILRVNTDGTIPDDNPILRGASARTAAYSFGHRNPQGLSFEPGSGRAFAVEHGQNDHDEINLIRPGGNFGWPVHAGPGGTGQGFADPHWSSGPAGTLATSGAAFATGPQWGLWSGSLFVASLKEADLRRFTIDGDVATEREILLDRKYGRLRSVVLAPNGSLYVTTSNGSGDRIVRLTASQTP